MSCAASSGRIVHRRHLGVAEDRPPRRLRAKRVRVVVQRPPSRDSSWRAVPWSILWGSRSRVAIGFGVRPLGDAGSTAPTRKQMAPTNVPRLIENRLAGSPVVGTMFDATADTPNAIEPTRLSAAMRHEMLCGIHDTSRGPPRRTRARWQRGSRSTRSCRASRRGVRLRRVQGRVRCATSVVTLKNTVPTSCTALAHQSMRRRLHARETEAAGAPVSRPERARRASRSGCTGSNAADVKKIEPTKNVIASARKPTQAR